MSVPIKSVPIGGACSDAVGSVGGACSDAVDALHRIVVLVLTSFMIMKGHMKGRRRVVQPMYRLSQCICDGSPDCMCLTPQMAPFFRIYVASKHIFRKIVECITLQDTSVVIRVGIMDIGQIVTV